VPFFSSKRAASRCAALAVALLCAACSQGARPNAVLVVVDTLRADHLGAYGYERDTSPFLDELSQRGLLFEHAVAQAPWTSSAMASLWTSRYVSETGTHARAGEDGRRHIDKHRASRCDGSLPTLASVLAGAGFRTIAVVANEFAGDAFGLLQGFDVRVHRGNTAGEAVDVALRQLGKHLRERPEQPFFLYVHVIDVHAPTDPPMPYRALFRAADGKPHARAHERWAYRSAAPGDSPEVDAYIDHKTALYDGAIAYVDSQIRRLWETLGTLGVGERTFLAVTSDHGEELWDSPDFRAKYEFDPRGIGSVGHGHSLLEELLRVPLLLAGPGIEAARVSTRVAQIDVAPGLLELLGVEAPAGFRGRSLLATAAAESRRSSSSEQRDGRPLLSEDIAYGYDAKALYLGRYKYIAYQDAPDRPAFLFDLAADPEEKHDLAAERPQIVREMVAALEELTAGLEPAQADRSVPRLDEETERRLEALGYVE
jgi:arylsulfatase A-like enzyme